LRKPSSRRRGPAKPARHLAPPSIDIIVHSPHWRAERAIAALLRRAIRTAAAMAAVGGGELAVMLADDNELRALNHQWRAKDEPTNVLSFPAGAACGGPLRPLGDIAIAFETAAREARSAQLPLSHHLTHLAVHGFLHLVGYDHQTEPDAEAMEALEIAVLARLGVGDPYARRDAEAHC
jgi:probable rRNA maturation factor